MHILSKTKLKKAIIFIRMEKIIAKKKFGQNFLKDKTVLHKIIEAMPKSDNKIVEIGPGLGDLTEELVKYKEVIAYEVDADLIGVLENKFRNQIKSSKLTIKFGDVLDFWKENRTLYSEGKYDLIANLPYYIATNIILNAFDDINCESIIVMIQKEVADKFTAKGGDSEFSALGVISDLIAQESKIVTIVPPEAFMPMPKVDSAVIYIKKKPNFLVEKGFKDFLRAAFSSPRKKLSKNLTSIIRKERLDILYKELEIKEDIRPHELSSSLYRQIYKEVIKNGNKQN